MKEFLAFMKKRAPQVPLDNLAALGVSIATATVQVLKQCGKDLSRQNVVNQTMNLDMELPLVLPGLRVRTSPKQRELFTAMRLQEFDGSRWALMRA